MNNSKYFKVCFTGHRPNKLSWKYNEELDSCKKFKFDIENMLIKAIKIIIATLLVVWLLELILFVPKLF